MGVLFIIAKKVYFYSFKLTVVDPMFSIGQVIMGIIVILIIYRIAKDYNSKRSNPTIAAAATVITKRQELSSSGLNNSNYTWYYVTFEFDTRDRIELSVSGREYGLMAEHDKGMLTFQGNKFIGFDRTRA